MLLCSVSARRDAGGTALAFAAQRVCGTSHIGATAWTAWTGPLSVIASTSQGSKQAVRHQSTHSTQGKHSMHTTQQQAVEKAQLGLQHACNAEVMCAVSRVPLAGVHGHTGAWC